MGGISVTLSKFASIFALSSFAFIARCLLKASLQSTMSFQGKGVELYFRVIRNACSSLTFWAALCFYGAATLVYLLLLRGDQVGKIYALIVAINLILTTFGSWIFLNGSVDSSVLAGVFFIIIGVFLLR